MGQFSMISKVLLLLIAHTVAQKVLDCRPGLSGLKPGYGPNPPTPSA